MLPKKITDSELREAFERILQIPEHIYDLNVGEATELLRIALEEKEKLERNRDLNDIVEIEKRFNRRLTDEEVKAISERRKNKFEQGIYNEEYFHSLGQKALLEIWRKEHPIPPELEENEKIIKLLEARIAIPYSSQTGKKKKVKIESISDFLINIPKDQINLFCQALVYGFQNDYGMGYRYMIEALKELGYLTYGDRERAKLHRALINLFKKDIGSYNGLFAEKNLIDSNIQNAILKIKSLVEPVLKIG